MQWWLVWGAKLESPAAGKGEPQLRGSTRSREINEMVVGLGEMQRDNARRRDSAVVRMVEGVEPVVVRESKVAVGRVMRSDGSYERKAVKVGKKKKKQ